MPVCPQCRKENPELGAKCPRCADNYYIYEQAVEEAREDPYIGQKAAGKYVVVAKISEGGMGAVYRALQLPVEREVALKVLRTELEDNTEVRSRFTREARAVSKINHPNIITLHDFGFDASDYPYMVMEYAPGRELDEWIYEPGRSLDRIIHVFRQLLSALAEAHQQGIVHRDLKPENIVVTSTGTDDDFVKILDFGIARLLNEQATTGLTREGEVFGTPHYMSPEQAEGQTGIGPEADVYAAGIIFYEMLCGEVPFDAPKPLPILFKQINEELPDLDAREDVAVPDPLESVVRRATSKDPDDRYADAGELLRALENLTDTDASNVIRVPEEERPPKPESSETIVGTGGDAAAGGEKRSAEEAGTAETLGVENADVREREKLEPLESGEVDVETPEPVSVEFERASSTRRRKLAMIAVAAFIFAGLFGVLLYGGGDEDPAVASEEAGEPGATEVAAGAGRGEAGREGGAGPDAGSPERDGITGDESTDAASAETAAGAPEPSGERRSDGQRPAAGASGNSGDRAAESPNRTGSDRAGSDRAGSGSPDGPTDGEGRPGVGAPEPTGSAGGAPPTEDDEPTSSSDAPPTEDEPGEETSRDRPDEDREPKEAESPSEAPTEADSSSDENLPEVEKFGAPEGDESESDDDGEPEKFAPPER